MSGTPPVIKVRPTAVLIEDGRILLLEQRVSDHRQWSLPGGTLEMGETIEECLVREMQEETGLLVSMDRLLYVCERIEDDTHVIHLTFLVRRQAGHVVWGREPEAGAQTIKSVRMVPLTDLSQHGFSARFCELVRDGFPGSGSHRGAARNIGL